MLTHRSELLDLKNPRNYLVYGTGIAVELAAIVVLTAIGYAVAVIGVWLFT